MELEVEEQHEAHSKAIPILWNHLFLFREMVCVRIKASLLSSLLKAVVTEMQFTLQEGKYCRSLSSAILRGSTCPSQGNLEVGVNQCQSLKHCLGQSPFSPVSPLTLLSVRGLMLQVDLTLGGMFQVPRAPGPFP